MKFLLIDDHAVVRSGIKGLLKDLYVSCEVHEASDDKTALDLIKQNTYDLIMMDIHVPQCDMMGLMEYLHVRYPEAKVLVFSMGGEHIYAKRFLKAGAKGFISKNSNFEEVGRAISIILSGRKFISETLAETLAEESVSETSSNPFNRLSPREFDVISLLLTGQSPADICKSLNLQTSTVGTLKSRGFEKLGINNLLELKDLATVYNFGNSI